MASHPRRQSPVAPASCFRRRSCALLLSACAGSWACDGATTLCPPWCATGASSGQPCAFDSVHVEAGPCTQGLTCLGLLPDPDLPCASDSDCLGYGAPAWNPQCVGGSCGASFCAAPCAPACPASTTPRDVSGTCFCVPETGCTPDCSGRECGPDPICGESCGLCASGSCTAAGACREGCTPDCGDRVCGADPVCGMSCGQCSGTCTSDGRCSLGGSGCLNPGGGTGACGADDDCCSGYCRDCWCQGWRKNGAPCTDSSQCLWGVCEGVCTCHAAGTPCTSDPLNPIARECCGLQCVNGRCAVGVMTEGSPCWENRWCISGLCLNGRCGELWCPADPGRLAYQAPCTADDQCASGWCSGEAGNCACVETGGGCGEDRNCCHLACIGGVCD